MWMSEKWRKSTASHTETFVVIKKKKGNLLPKEATENAETTAKSHVHRQSP